MFRIFLFFIGLLLGLPILTLVVLAFRLPITLSGIGYLFGVLLIAIGLILAPRVDRFYMPIAIGILIVLLVASIRLFLVHQTNASIKVLALPQGKGTSWINTLIDEQDTLIFGETVFHWVGGDSEVEHAGLTSAFRNV